jgi:hypothetical protein
MIQPNVTLESMPVLIRKYEEEQMFASVSTDSVFHGTMWPTLEQATFVLWIIRITTFSCKSLTFNLNITLTNADGFFIQ